MRRESISVIASLTFSSVVAETSLTLVTGHAAVKMDRGLGSVIALLKSGVPRIPYNAEWKGEGADEAPARLLDKSILVLES
jgi:hypothetical protein